MPTYEYRCADCGHAFDIVQAFTDDSLTVCPECGGRLKKVFGSVGIAFKGSGFYVNDSGSSKHSHASSDAGSGSDSSTSNDSGSDSSASSTSSNGSKSDVKKASPKKKSGDKSKSKASASAD